MWLDEFQQVVFAHSLGQPYRWPTVRGVLWHTTEGWSAEGAFSRYSQFPCCPHITAEWEFGIERVSTQRRFQHIPTDSMAYAVQHGDANHVCHVETNASGIVQIEVVGFAAETGSYPLERLRWLGEKVLAPILAAHPTIPPWVYPASAPRMTEDEWAAWPGGQCRHADVCCQPESHTDPGDLDLDVILHYALELNLPPLPKDDDDMVILTLANPDGTPSVADGAFAYNGTHLRWVNDGNEYAMLVNDIKAKLVAVSDEKLRATIASTAKVGPAPTSGRYAHTW